MPRGRVVGGSSVTNGAIALRGHPEHYDEWDGWVDGYGWETWLPWFCAVEGDRDFGGEPLARRRGADPRSAATRAPTGTSCRSASPRRRWRSATPGWTTTTPPGPSGSGRSRSTCWRAVRQTPADHYLDPALGRANLSLRAGRADRPRPLLAASGPRGSGCVGADGAETLAADAGGHGPRHLRHPGGAPALGRRPGRRARPPRHPGGGRARRGGAGDAGPPEGLLPLRPGPRRRRPGRTPGTSAC